jgi:hypothetical protein
MKKINLLWALAFLFASCDPNNYLEDMYVKPTASFEIPKAEYDVYESVLFSNMGTGQYFVVYPGDENHVYQKMGNSGFATNSAGTFSYSYQEPGEYTAVWVASSINARGEKEYTVDSVKIKVMALNGGLDKLSIYNINRLDEYSTGGVTVYYTSYGEFVSPDTLLCPIMFAAWRNATINSIKAKLLVNFELASNTAKMYWMDNDVEKEIISMSSASRIVYFVQDGKLAVQNFRVKTASGVTADYYVAPVMIPQLTKFSILGVNATLARSISDYDVFSAEVILPSGTDLTQLTPVFEVMGNDPNLLDGTNCQVTANSVVQISGTSVVDFSGGTVVYTINYSMLGETNTKLNRQAIVTVKVRTS